MNANQEAKIAPVIDINFLTCAHRMETLKMFEDIVIEEGAHQIQQSINTLKYIASQLESQLAAYNRESDKDARINNLQHVTAILTGMMSNIRFDLLAKSQLDMLKVEHRKLGIILETENK